jgi:hypothetical protein
MTRPLIRRRGIGVSGPKTRTERPRWSLVQGLREIEVTAQNESRPVGAAASDALILDLAKHGRLGQGEENDLFASDRANVVVQTHDCDPSDFLDHSLHERTRGFEEMCAHALEQFSTFLGRKRLDQMLFRRRPPAESRGRRRSSGCGCPLVRGP